MNLTIKHKQMLLAAFVLLALLSLLWQGRAAVNQQTKLNQVVEATYQLQLDMLTLRRNEKDFLMRQQLKYQQQFDKNIQAAQHTLTQLEQRLVTADLPLHQASALQPLLTSYQQAFSQLAEATVTRGLNKDEGHYGKLRRATHQLESYLQQQNNDRALVLLLTLRRHEKDFMLRDDAKYQQRLQTTAEQLSSTVAADPQALAVIEQYVAEFDAFFNISKQIGLSEKLGTRGEMRAAVHQLEQSLTLLNERYKQQVQQAAENSKLFQLVVSVLICSLILAGMFVISQQIIAPVQHIARAFEDMRKSDDLTKRIQILRQDEIGAATKDFNILIDYFHQVVKKIYHSVERLDSATGVVTQNVYHTKKYIERQQVQSDLVATAVTEMGAAATDIARNAESTAEKVTSAHQSAQLGACLLYTSPSPRDQRGSRMPSSA